MADDKIPVRVPGLSEPVLFPRGMSEADIQTIVERDILPNIPKQPAPTGGPMSRTSSGGIVPRPDSGEPDTSVASVVPVTSLAPMVLPATGQAVGGAFGGLPGAVVGGAAGEGANQILGITEPSPEAVALNAVIPAAAKGVTKAIQYGATKLPGAAATLHDMAKVALEKLGSIFGPAQSSASLYAIVDQAAPTIAIPNLTAATAKLLTKEQMAAAGLKMPGPVGVGEELVQRSLPTGELPFQDIRENLVRIGDMIRQTRAQGGRDHGAWKLAYKGLMDDLDAAAASGQTQVADTLKAANAAARREFVQEEIADIFGKGGLTSRPDIGPDAYQVNFGRIADAIRKGKHAEDIKATLRPEEYQQLIQTVSDLAKVTPNLPPPRGQFAGSAIKLGQMGSAGAIGTLVAPTFGISPTVGGAAGVIMATKGVDAITRLMMSDTGRQLLASFLSQSGGVLTQKSISLLGAAAAQLPEVKGVTTHLGNLGRDYMGTK